MAVNKYLFIFLALVACQCHEFIVAHGRKIKAMNQHSSPNTNSNTNTNTSVAKSTHLPSLDSSVNSQEQHYEEVSSVGDSVTNYDNAFRPTTPGGSPGVGHRIITSSEDHNVKTIVAVHSPRVEVSVTQDSKDDLKTGPGHSPGVGHKN